MMFRLLEYTDHKATYSNSDKVVLKCKINGVVSEYPLGGIAPNGDLRIAQESDAMRLATVLSANVYDISCVIEIDSSKYSFVLSGTGFAEQDKKLKAMRIENITKNPELHDALANATHNLEFILKYAGNGKFADSFLEKFISIFSEIDIDRVAVTSPKMATVLPKIRGNIETIHDLLVDQGETSRNVTKIRNLCENTLELILQHKNK